MRNSRATGTNSRLRNIGGSTAILRHIVCTFSLLVSFVYSCPEYCSFRVTSDAVTCINVRFHNLPEVLDCLDHNPWAKEISLETVGFNCNCVWIKFLDVMKIRDIHVLPPRLTVVCYDYPYERCARQWRPRWKRKDKAVANSVAVVSGSPKPISPPAAKPQSKPQLPPKVREPPKQQAPTEPSPKQQTPSKPQSPNEPNPPSKPKDPPKEQPPPNAQPPHKTKPPAKPQEPPKSKTPVEPHKPPKQQPPPKVNPPPKAQPPTEPPQPKAQPPEQQPQLKAKPQPKAQTPSQPKSEPPPKAHQAKAQQPPKAQPPNKPQQPPKQELPTKVTPPPKAQPQSKAQQPTKAQPPNEPQQPPKHGLPTKVTPPPKAQPPLKAKPLNSPKAKPSAKAQPPTEQQQPIKPQQRSKSQPPSGAEPSQSPKANPKPSPKPPPKATQPSVAKSKTKVIITPAKKTESKASVKKHEKVQTGDSKTASRKNDVTSKTAAKGPNSSDVDVSGQPGHVAVSGRPTRHNLVMMFGVIALVISFAGVIGVCVWLAYDSHKGVSRPQSDTSLLNVVMHPETTRYSHACLRPKAEPYRLTPDPPGGGTMHVHWVQPDTPLKKVPSGVPNQYP